MRQAPQWCIKKGATSVRYPLWASPRSSASLITWLKCRYVPHFLLLVLPDSLPCFQLFSSLKMYSLWFCILIGQSHWSDLISWPCPEYSHLCLTVASCFVIGQCLHTLTWVRFDCPFLYLSFIPSLVVTTIKPSYIPRLASTDDLMVI